ncbi:mitochondrial inner membrane protease ATP23 [Thecamonas trahens ATCC 50062]|uniref:Mitochondrial inner membrane protease ATP23 n=1 Tax=Thecamonas trahens ATCC 50062 TaxID=461836 RepID=A0A0L0D1V6_THETB|nr:mitochondrial inner membrane protease ATP23 [Thecamonas trahens ATCC 50062]KNC46252.1 mitochondrial inner membrane protease ATP23 [Thecamonas trahens ATCC 50062]|eukprot:XP_013760546.1 mitochondrial inner membrane protease ATP23 [Thecamonas trahens ATCC 50062]
MALFCVRTRSTRMRKSRRPSFTSSSTPTTSAARSWTGLTVSSMLAPRSAPQISLASAAGPTNSIAATLTSRASRPPVSAAVPRSLSRKTRRARAPRASRPSQLHGTRATTIHARLTTRRSSLLPSPSSHRLTAQVQARAGPSAGQTATHRRATAPRRTVSARPGPQRQRCHRITFRGLRG